MPFLPDSRVLVEALDAVRWRLAETLVYEGEVDRFVVPAGYVTDFATVPRIAVWLIPRFGNYTRAAILHDWLLTDALPAGMVTARDADGIFRRVLRELGVPVSRRSLMWVGVRLGSLFSRDSKRRVDWFKDSPRVVLGVVAYSWLSVPMAVVGLALGVWAAIELVVTFVTGRKPSTGSLST